MFKYTTIALGVGLIISIVSLIVVTKSKNMSIEELNKDLDSMTLENQSLSKKIIDLNNLNHYMEVSVDSVCDFETKVETIQSDKDSLKEVIYEEVISNEEASDWFNEKVPDNLKLALADALNGRMCDN